MIDFVAMEYRFSLCVTCVSKWLWLTGSDRTSSDEVRLNQKEGKDKNRNLRPPLYR